MSLINQMLKDIDKRQGGATGLSDSVGLRYQSPRARSSSRALVWVGGLLVVGAGLYGVRWWTAPAAPAAVAALPAPAVKPAEPMVLPSSPVAEAPQNTQAQAQVEIKTPPKSEPAKAENPPEPIKPVAVAPKQAKELVDAAPVNAVPAAVASVETGKTTAKKEPVAPVVPGAVARVVSPEQRADNAYREAALLVRQGRGADAQRILKQVLADLPAHQDARLLSARLSMDEGRWAEAKALLADGLALKPQGFQMYATLAHAQLITKDTDAAVATLERGLPQAGENAEYQALLATALQQQSRHAEAVQHYVTALRQQPDASNWLVGLGVSLQAQGNTQGAAEAFQRALDLGLPASLSQFARERLQQLSR